MKDQFPMFTEEKPQEEFARPSPRMIHTLKGCLEMENKYPGRSYGPGDIKGSFLGLYKRGLLGIKSKNNSPRTSWYVTTEGLNYLLNISATAEF